MKSENKSKQTPETTSAGGGKPRMSVPVVNPIPKEDKKAKAAVAASGENVPVVTPIPKTGEQTDNKN